MGGKKKNKKEIRLIDPSAGFKNSKKTKMSSQEEHEASLRIRKAIAKIDRDAHNKDPLDDVMIGVD